MKVLHLNTYDIFGGAAKGMYVLHKALLQEGINSQVLVNKKQTNDSTIISIVDEIQMQERIHIDNFPLQVYPNKKKDLISNAIIDSPKLLEKIEEINPDIIHMHWVCHALLSIEDIAKINRPIIWTLRDMWSFTGGCHHAITCDKFKKNCGECPILTSENFYDITFQQLQRKERTFANSQITFVGISPWMSKIAQQSHLLKHTQVLQIDNNYDSNSFYKEDIENARKYLKINTTKKIISIGCHSLNDEHKGIKYFLEMLSFLDLNDFYILFFGNEDQNIFSNLQHEFKSFGFIDNCNMLRYIYSLSDIFVAPSLLEPFGKTIVESLACGTPVVCFENTGGPDHIITHKKDGYKAKFGSSSDLAYGIKWILNSNYTEVSKNAQNKAKQFSAHKIAQQYINLYQEQTKKTFLKPRPSSIEPYKNLLKIHELQSIVDSIKHLDVDNILIYGNGYLGQLIYKECKEKILGFLDKDSSKIDNKLIYHPQKIHSLDYSKIIISVLNREKEIISYLSTLNVEKDKIIQFPND